VRPPNYRRAERTKLGATRDSCTDCVHEVILDGGRPVCIPYLCYLRLGMICDDFKGDNPSRRPGLRMYFHDPIPDRDTASYLRSGELSDEGA
jgi:hypothetical protein